MNILFINHSASRTGAPIVLLHFLKWLYNNKNINFDVLTLKDKDLLNDFTEVSKNHYYNLQKETLLPKSIRFLKRKFYNNIYPTINYPLNKLDAISKTKYDLIYANTVVSIPVASYIKNKSKFKPKLIAHLHELNLTIHRECLELSHYKNNIDFTIAASQKVKNNLIANWGFKEMEIKVIYEYSAIPEIATMDSDAFIVGGSGQVDWRKGTDFFVMVADYVLKKLPNENIRFQWVGKISALNRLVYEEDLNKLNIKNKVDFTGLKNNPHDYFSNFDVFLMTSKEDPFPLVCIEIGMMGIPMVCFEGATGTEEVLKNVGEAVVPYLDIAAMGDIVIRYYKDDKLKKINGEKMKAIFKDFTPEKQSLKLLSEIESLIGYSIN